MPTENKALYEGAYFEATAHADLSRLETHIDMLGINLVNITLPETPSKKATVAQVMQLRHESLYTGMIWHKRIIKDPSESLMVKLS